VADPYGDGKIHLLPAWPKEWDVDFKLHASEQTTVEASVKAGRVVSLKVTPESRRKDVIVNSEFGGILEKADDHATLNKTGAI